MVKKGDPIISIHIPQGEKLTLESVRESIIQGMAFWGKVQRNLKVYSENTSLQRAAKKYLKSGKVLGSGLGILKPEYFL